VASNFSVKEKSVEEVLAWHNERGQAENFNKELKCGFGLEQTVGSVSSCAMRADPCQCGVFQDRSDCVR